MDMHSLVTNAKTAELIFNLLIQIIAVSMTGLIIMKLLRPRSAPARSAGYLTILLSLAILPVISTMFSVNRITWFQTTIDLPQSYTRQSSPDSFQGQQKNPEERITIDNEWPENRPDSFEESESFNPAPVPETDHQKYEAAPAGEQQENHEPSDKNNNPFLTRELILISVNIFGGMWIAGFILFALRLGYKLSFLKGYMHNLNSGDIERLKNIYSSIKHVFKDKPIPEIYFSSSLSSPVTIGIIRPVMILPVEMKSMSDDDLKSILLHELAHIFHRDNFIGFLQHVLSSIFWWNPLVYYLNSAYSDSREDVCDNYAINVLKSPKKYANTLLNLAEKTHFLSHMPATAGMSLSRRSFERRVVDLLRTDRDLSTIYKPSLIILSLILAIVITSCGTGMKISLKEADYPGDREYIELSSKPLWVIGNNIIQKIHTGEFKYVEKYVDHLVKEKPYTVDGTRVLEKLYSFVAERLESSEMLDKWCAEDNPHYASFIFRGRFYIYEGAKHRGKGLGYTVTEEGRQKFRENLKLARKDLEKAYTMNPADPNSAAAIIAVCTGLGLGEEEMDIWFYRAIDADPVTYISYSGKQNFIRPKWYGTPEKDRSFAEQCYETAPPNSIIHEIMLDYIIENYYWGGDKTNYYNDPVILKEIDDVAQKTLKIFPNSTSIRSKLAEIETRKGNYGQAVELYSEILTIEPGNPGALSRRGKLYAGNLRQLDLAEADLKLSIESDPYGPDNYEELASIARMNGNYRKAIEYYNVAINRKPKNPQLYIDRGGIKRNPLREYESALEDFKQAVKLDIDHIGGNFSMALCYESMQQFEEAKKYCMKTLSLIEARSPEKGSRSLSPAFYNEMKNKLAAMQSRLDPGASRVPATRGRFYPQKEINYTIAPSPGEGWQKGSAGQFNDMLFVLPAKNSMIIIGQISIPEGQTALPLEDACSSWMTGMENKYKWENMQIKSSGKTTVDGHETFYIIFEYKSGNGLQTEKVYYVQGDSSFYRIRYGSLKNTFNDNLQTFENYVKSFKISSQSRLDPGASRVPVARGSFYPQTAINYTIAPSPGEGWQKGSAGPFNDMLFILPAKHSMIIIGQIPISEGQIVLPLENACSSWMTGMENKYNWQNMQVNSTGKTTVDGHETFYIVFEYKSGNGIQTEKVYFVQGDSSFYRIRYGSLKNTFNDNLQTFENYVKSFKISS